MSSLMEECGLLLLYELLQLSSQVLLLRSRGWIYLDYV